MRNYFVRLLSTHMKAFAAALESLQKPAFSIGQIPPTPGVVNQFFNDSTGQGDDGEVDARGPWNEGGEWEYVEAPALKEFRSANGTAKNRQKTENESFSIGDLLTAELGQCLQDLLHAEGQLLKALPKMVKAARSADLQQAFAKHLTETERQVERLKEVFESIGVKPKTKPCKGMAGLVTEGQEVITDGKEKEDIAADLALIAAAQKVEHYEISSYLSARALASQAGNSDAARLLNQSLLEEERADKILSRLASILMEEGAGLRPTTIEDELPETSDNGKAKGRSAKK